MLNTKDAFSKYYCRAYIDISCNTLWILVLRSLILPLSFLSIASLKYFSTFSTFFLFCITSWTPVGLYRIQSFMFSFFNIHRQHGFAVCQPCMRKDISFCSGAYAVTSASRGWELKFSPSPFVHPNPGWLASQRGIRMSSNACCNSFDFTSFEIGVFDQAVLDIFRMSFS